MGAEHLGYGMYYFAAETDPVKIQQAAETFDEWKGLFDQIKQAQDLHGWESPECQLALIEMKDWQQQRRLAHV